MISLAANGPAALKTLLQETALPLNYIKCPLSAHSEEEVKFFRAYCPVLLHGWGPNFWIGQRQIPEPELLQMLTPISGTPYLSTHLEGRADEFDGPLTEERLLARTQANVAALHKLTELETLLENIPYYPWIKAPRFVSDPEFICDALAVAETRMLLDISHAQVSAYHRGEDFSNYLTRLPMDKVVEMHVSGARMEDDGLRDRHVALTEDDYTLIEGLLCELPALQVLTLEYGGAPEFGSTPGGQKVRIDRNDPHMLREQIFRLQAILASYHAGIVSPQ